MIKFGGATTHPSGWKRMTVEQQLAWHNGYWTPAEVFEAGGDTYYK